MEHWSGFTQRTRCTKEGCATSGMKEAWSSTRALLAVLPVRGHGRSVEPPQPHTQGRPRPLQAHGSASAEVTSILHDYSEWCSNSKVRQANKVAGVELPSL
eukprot:1156636-Pelagomonas_calceolata.AAC.9